MQNVCGKALFYILSPFPVVWGACTGPHAFSPCAGSGELPLQHSPPQQFNTAVTFREGGRAGGLSPGGREGKPESAAEE